jgi:hypothetical protein
VSAYRTPGRVSVPRRAEKRTATGGITLWHLLEFISVGYGPGMAIGAAKGAGGGLARIAIAIAIGVAFGLACPFLIRKAGRVAFKAGVPPLPMYVSAGLFPVAWGTLALVVTTYAIGVMGPSR